MPTQSIKDPFNKKLMKMAHISNKKPSTLLEQIIEDYYFKFLKDNNLKDK